MRKGQRRHPEHRSQGDPLKLQLAVPRGEGKYLGIERLNERCFLISSAGNKKGIFLAPFLKSRDKDREWTPREKKPSLPPCPCLSPMAHTLQQWVLILSTSESPAELVETCWVPTTGFLTQQFWMAPKNFHFYQVPRCCCSYWSHIPLIRTAALQES